MKRKTNTPLSLRMALYQRGFFIFFGLAVALITGGMLWFNGRATTLSCQRLEPTRVDCVSQVKWLGLLPLTTRMVPQVQHASLSSTCSTPASADQTRDKRETCVYGVDLLTAAGVVALSPALASGGNREQKEAFVARVNAFLNDPAALTLQATQTEVGPQSWVLAGLMLTGLLAVIINLNRAIKAAR